MIVLFLWFFYRTWPERTQGTSQTWCWIRLGGNQRRTGHKMEGTPTTNNRWARLIWCFTVSRLSFWCLKNISWSVKGNISRWLTLLLQYISFLSVAYVPSTWENTKAEKAHRSLKILWNLHVSLLVSLHLPSSLSPSLSLPFFVLPSRCFFFPVLLYLAFCSFSKMFPAYPMINNYASASN